VTTNAEPSAEKEVSRTEPAGSARVRPALAERATETLRSRGLRFLTTFAQLVLRALWEALIPALAAAVVLRFFTPSVASGFPGLIAWLGRREPVLFGVGLFFVFSGLVRYWRFWLPGGRYASTLPADLVPGERSAPRLAEWARMASAYRYLASTRGRRAVARALPPAEGETVAQMTTELGAALQAADWAGARAATEALTTLVAPVLRARQRRSLATTAVAVGSAAVLALGIKAWVAQSYVVLSGSMLPTLEPKDRIAGNKLGWQRPFAGKSPVRGDVIVFRSSAVALDRRAGVPDVLVKRVIGLPGDRIGMFAGVPVINGWRVPTCDAGDYVYVEPDDKAQVFHARLRVEFIDDRAYLTVQGLTRPFRDPYLVQPGEVFVLGDNRSNSVDSRAYNEGHGGGVPLAGIDARAEWFLIGQHRSGDPDFGRFLRPIDGMQVRFRAEGVDTQAAEAGIAKCLANRPAQTHPPRPGEAPPEAAGEPPREPGATRAVEASGP
jgi:signal peptidase I